jgi:DNA-binding CsgD family transcriptional regulator
VTLNRRALETLRAAGEAADPTLIAHHADEAGDLPTLGEWGVRAAQHASASGAHREAAEQYARVLAGVPGLATNARAQLLEALAEERYMTAQLDGAIEAQEAALERLRETDDDGGLGDGIRRLSRMLFFAGRTPEGERAAMSAVALLERLPPGHALAMACCNVAQRYTVLEDRECADIWITRAAELAEQTDDDEARLYTLVNEGVTRSQEDLDDGREILMRALAQAQRTGFEEHAGRVFNHLAMWPLRVRELDLAEASVAAGLEYCGERGLDTWRLYLLAIGAQLDLARARWSEAGEQSQAVLADPHSASLARGWALTTLGLLRARRGDPDAERPLLEAGVLARSTREPGRLIPASAARAELAWLTGESEEIDELTQATAALCVQRNARWGASELAFWRWVAGADTNVPQELLTEPYALSIEGEWDRAASWWQRRRCPYECALALSAAPDEAGLRRAHEQFRALGAGPAAAVVARRLRALGVRDLPRGPRGSTRENSAGLTARELEVLELVDEGLRNADIAARLVISEKTVDHHVSAILRKLDVRTRGEAGARGRSLGMLGDASGAAP